MLFEDVELLDMVRSLNEEKNLPKMAFRRNVQIYELVSYVNNIIGCCISNNEKALPIFIERVRIFGDEHSELVAETEYFALVSNYLDSLEAKLGCRM